jgi:type IV secretion system protein VirB10
MSEEAAPTPEKAVKLRGDPPRVMRLSRKAIGIASACGFAIVGGAHIYALQPASQAEREELLNTDGAARPDALADAPRDYGDVPKLGPPLPGDLGAPILAAQQRGDVAELPPIGAGPPAGPAPTPAQTAAETERQRLVQERSAARESRLFFGGGAGAAAVGDGSGVADASSGPPVPQLAAEPPRPAFAERPVERRTVSASRIKPPAGTHVLQAGSIIPAALITGIRSDLPGQVTAQVTEPVYDSVTGRILLIPQGSRLIGDYNADVSFGQRRVQLAWNRLILPDGRSIVLERQPGGDPSGFAGLQDGVDFHWGGVLRAALVSTLLGVGGELGAGDDSNLARALRRGSQDSIGRAGEQVVSRELDVRPTLTIRPGFPVRVLVTRDLILGGGS